MWLFEKQKGYHIDNLYMQMLVITVFDVRLHIERHHKLQIR
jgi:hypothetical protein